MLAAVGMSRRQLFWLGMVRGALVGAVGAAAAVALAFALSPLTPIGLARVAEPAAGLSFDAGALTVGALVVLAVTLALTAVPAWRVARRLGAVRGAGKTSALGTAAAGTASPPSIGVGVRMAMEPGSGETAVPVRSAMLSATLAIATLIAALTFWSSLDHLVGTPRLSGYVFDMFSAPPTDAQGHVIPAGVARMRSVLQADRNVAAYARGGVVNIRVNGHGVVALLTVPSGPMAPVVTAGRAPRTTNEIALGRLSMQRAGVAIGDAVRVQVDDSPKPPPPRSFRVVGEVITPTSLVSESDPGEGAALLPGAAYRLEGPALTRDMVTGLPFLIRFRDGIDQQAEVDRLLKALPDGTYSVPAEHRGDISTLGRISSVPLAFALLLGVLALATLAQTLVTSVRARRRDLAVLKTLGFSRGQIRAAVAWQASTLVVTALAVGIPVGVVAGRWIWRAFADGLAVMPLPILTPVAVVGAAVGTLVLANLIAAIPARTPARTRAAAVLRSE